MKKTYIYSLLAALLLAVVAMVYFFPDDIEGNVLQQHDTMQGLANGQEGAAYKAATGETTRWTNSLFSGMPNFQISPSYPANKTLTWLGRAYSLWLPAPANLLFIMMTGFFIMCLCFGLRWYTALFAAVGWGFSTYFMIIIGAGHIWKFVTLAYIPPTIGGIMLCYRGKYLAGTALAALFGALQLQSNHLQMSYYFCFVILFLMLAWLYNALRKHRMKRWSLATLCTLAAGVMAVGANSSSLYNSFEYAKETVRGKATDLTVPGGNTSGMDPSNITAWSYGLDETFTLLVPNVKGGASVRPEGGNTRFLTVDQTDKAGEMFISPEVRGYLNQFTQYFGDQPGTNGPVYVGAFLLVLAVLSLFVVDGAVKWALFAASILAIALSWGHNFPLLTDFFISSFPGYNRFRAVASILVIVEFCVPLLAALCVRKIVDTPDFLNRYKWTLYTVTGLAAAVCIVGWLSPSVFGQPFSAGEISQFSSAGVLHDPAYAPLWDAVRQTRYSLVQADCIRSLIFIALGFGVVMLRLKGALPGNALFVCVLTAVTLIDLYPVNKRYVSTSSFVEPQPAETAFRMTDADRAILADPDPNYRVLDAGDFGGARSSYFHKTIGGYHAAKLTRYNDLIEHQIRQGNPEVLNMLNTKYILNGNQYSLNPDALGNAWLVDSISYIDGADAEMAALDSIRPGEYAVADRKFEPVLGKAGAIHPGDTIYAESYAPNRLSYRSRSAKGNLAVFSEIYFPWGWKAEIDGKEYPVGRVDYVLRALRIPAGEHHIVFTFDPQSVKTTDTISLTSVIIIYIICALAVVLWTIHIFSRPARSAKAES